MSVKCAIINTYLHIKACYGLHILTEQGICVAQNAIKKVEIPKINYIVVRGKGNPNDENGDYKSTLGLLYGVAYTIKMSYKGNHKIDGFFQYVVPPLEGFWWQDGMKKGTIDYNNKNALHFISVIRLPDFVKKIRF